MAQEATWTTSSRRPPGSRAASTSPHTAAPLGRSMAAPASSELFAPGQFPAGAAVVGVAGSVGSEVDALRHCASTCFRPAGIAL